MVALTTFYITHFYSVEGDIVHLNEWTFCKSARNITVVPGQGI